VVGTTESAPGPAHARWTSRRALAAHVALVVFVPGCIAAAIWQVGVARSGNDIGWAYAIMWPLFAVYGVVFWWHLVHDDPETVGARGLRRLRSAQGPDPAGENHRAIRDEAIRRAEHEDPELAAYNAYLAELARQDMPKTWRRR
jgi:hypothetical protein